MALTTRLKDEVIKIQSVLTEALNDADKGDQGNNAAITRVREAMQSVKRTADSTRKIALEVRNEHAANRGKSKGE